MTSIGTSEPRALDGGMGTALIARGLPRGTVPEAWLLERPDEIVAVHASHRAAGADVLLTCTFNLASSRNTTGDVGVLAGRAVQLARAAGGAALVAGAVGPSGAWRGNRPASEGVGDIEALYSRAFEALATCSPDLLWAESQWVADEARLALRCASRTGRPAAVTIAFAGRADGRAALPDGTEAEPLLVELAELGAAAVGVNCVLPGTPGVAELLGRVAARVHVPVIAKPSPGLPGRVMSPRQFGAWCAELRRAGALWIGGCCGATAEHVAAAARAAHGP